MAEIRTKSEEREYLSRLIADWNASRLDIFAIGEPTEDLEYRGVMRFFFQDSGSKVATKCVRFTNRDNTDEVTKVLVEKFHPDMKMLSNPTYSLYEVHPNGDALKMRVDEYPLRVQLEWQLDDREGRFLLKSDSDKIVHSNLFDVKSSDKTPQAGQNLKRRLSKREKKQLKKQREEAKKAAEKSSVKDDNKIAQHLYDELPETSFTRSISNPEAVMRRRRQQKLEKKLKDFQSKDSPAGGTLKIFATTLKPEIPYKTLLVSVDDTTTHVVKEALAKYQMEKEDPEEYCLVMVNIPVEGTNTSATLGKERVVHDEDCPLKIAVTWPTNRGTVVFHLRRRANLPQHRRDKRRSKSPVRQPLDLTPDRAVGERLAKPAYPDHLLPYLLELSSDGNDLDFKPRMHRLQMNATDVGSEKTFSSGGNYLQLHAPHILPRHCVITNMDGRVSVTPSSGDAEVLVNGKRVYETTQLQHGDVAKIGRMHTFRFCDPAYEKPQRHSAPAAGETGSISSNSDIDVQRKPRPQSLGSTLPRQHSNSYPNNSYPNNSYPSNSYQDNDIDAHVDVDTNEQPEGMFETTFDVSGEVKTYTGGHREPESYTYSRPPDSPTKTTFNDDMYDDKLPATLEFRENGEDAFFAAVISEVNGLAVHFKLAPTYTLYMCSRYRMSPHYKTDLMEHQRGERLGVTILKIANMARSTIRENAEMPGSLAFWMANCSEFLHFVKQDMDISPYTKDGQQVLAQSVQLAFRHLVLCVQHELRTTMSAFLDPTNDADMEDSDLDSMNDSDNDHLVPSDGRSFRVQNKYGPDGRPLFGGDSWLGGRRVHGRATVSEVIFNLSSTMSLLRRCRVNAALTIQVFSQLFHFINMWLFNKMVLEPKLELCTREWGRRISKRLARVEKWAEKQGLELAADCHLCRIAQAAHLLQAPKNSSSDISAISSSCFKLNSLQMRTLLENYRPANDEYIPQEYIEHLVTTAEEKADEVARSNGQEIQREEETDLQLPFLLPEDGYSCDVIRGVPPGLQGFLEPLANTGLCGLTIQPETSGLWTVYQRRYKELGVDVPVTITPDIQEVTFNKGRGGMGLSIVAAKGIRQDKLGIYIKQVVKDGPASKDGRLQAGDQILLVNGESLVGVTQEKAAEVMVKSGSIVTLKIVKQGAIYHGLATMLIQQSPNRETAPPPIKRLTPVDPDPEPEPMQLSLTLPDDDINSSGRWIPDVYTNGSTTQREDEESMREDSLRRAKDHDRLFEERMRLEDEERMTREDEERMAREDEERMRQEDERTREEKERVLQEEAERFRIEEDRLYEEKLRQEDEDRRKQEEEDRRALRIRQEKQEEERKKREEEEDEKFRIQEDRIRKRMEEERKIIEEERRKLAEERRLLEEERKRETEWKRTEEQRLLEQDQRLAEEKQLIEEERRRVLNHKKGEDESRRLEEERMALLAQRRRAEEQREMAEEQRRREEIRKREEYRRMEDQRRLAEERKRSEEEERLRPIETKQRTRKIRFEDEVVAAAENAPKVETVQYTLSSPQVAIETKPENETRPIRASVESEIPSINKNPKDEYVEEEPVVMRGRLTEQDMSSMDAIFEKLEEEKQHERPSSLNYISRPANTQPATEEPPKSPMRVDSRDTRYGRAIVIKQGMLPSARSPTSQDKPIFNYDVVAQNLKAIDQSRRQKQDANNDDEFERWQKRQREVAEQREREAEEKIRHGREQEEMLLQQEQEKREQEQHEREKREREKRERELREQELREQRDREQRDREQRDREQREQREREQREQQERQERELRERLERENKEREELENQQRLERERLERERKEFLEQQRKEREEREKAELEKQRSLEEKKKREEAEEKQRLVERERQMLYPGSKGSKETLDYIEEMNEDEVEREFQRRLEVEKKRRHDDGYEDRRAGGLVSVTRVTYHPDRDDQMERDRKLNMIIQERKELNRERKESSRRVVFEGEREKQKELQRQQQQENEREQEDWLKQQREKHEQARRDQGRLRLDKKSQQDEDIMKKRSELQQRREQEEVVRMNLQRIRDETERKMADDHQQERLEQEREFERKLEEQKILIEKESEARKQLLEEQRLRSARGSTGEPDHVIELKERALKDYERRRVLIDQEINRHREDGRADEQLRQAGMEDDSAKFDQQVKPVSALKTSNGTKPKKQVSFSSVSTEFHEPSSPTYVVGSSSGYTAKITPSASVRLVQTRPPADPDSPPIPRPPPPDDDDYDDYDPPPLPPPPPPEELLYDDQFPPPPRSTFNDRSSSSSSMSSSDPRSRVDLFPADYPYPVNSPQFRNTVSNYGTYPRAARPVSYPTPADLDSLQFNDSVKYGGSNNNVSGFNPSSGIRETQSLGRITITDSSTVEANRIRMGRMSLEDGSRKEPSPISKKPDNLGFKDKMKMFNEDGTPKSRVSLSRWQRDQMDVNGDISYA